MTNEDKLDKICEPRLDSYVWVKFTLPRDSSEFYRVKVVAKGKDMFIHNEVLDSIKCEEYRVPHYYRAYGVTWFKSLKEIRQQYKIRKIDNDYYEEVRE